MRSINTQISNNTDSSRSTIMRQNTDHTEFLHYNQTIVVARKFEHPGKWSEHEESEFRRVGLINSGTFTQFVSTFLKIIQILVRFLKNHKNLRYFYRNFTFSLKIIQILRFFKKTLFWSTFWKLNFFPLS